MKEVFGENFYTPEETAVMLKKHIKTVLRMIADGRLPADTSGRPYWVSESTIKKLVRGEK